MFKKLVLLSISINLICSCTKEIIPPTLSISALSVNLGDITSVSKKAVALNKVGEGTITYTASSDKEWLVLDNLNGNLVLGDSLRFHVNLPSSTIAEGNNNANISLVPTINGVLSPAISITISGTYKATTMQVSESKIDIGTIKSKVSKTFLLTKTGLEKLDYEITTTQTPWLKINKLSGTITSPDTIKLSIDPNGLVSGPLNAELSIVSKVLGQSSNPSKLVITGAYDDTISGNVAGHTLTKNENWGGLIVLTGSITIPIGFKLIIKPGTQINIKKTSPLIDFKVAGGMFLNGNATQIIEIVSNEARQTNADWDGIKVEGNIEASYLYVKNALNVFNFENYSPTFNSDPKLDHILFDNNNINIFNISANNTLKLSNLSLRNNNLLGITSKAKNLIIENCEFLDELCYLDINILSNSGNININNSNFKLKKNAAANNLEVSTQTKFNVTTTTNCYQLNRKYNFGINGNTLFEKNALSSPNMNIGCGFAGKYN